MPEAFGDEAFGDGVIFAVKWQIALSPFGGWKPPLLGLRRFVDLEPDKGLGTESFLP